MGAETFEFRPTIRLNQYVKVVSERDNEVTLTLKGKQ
jgi:hypothetical protein